MYIEAFIRGIKGLFKGVCRGYIGSIQGFLGSRDSDWGLGFLVACC